MPNANYSQLADIIANEVAVPLGNVAVTEQFSGDTALETRQKVVEFIQHAQVLANNMHVLGEVLNATEQGVQQYQHTERLLDESTKANVDGNRAETGTVWGREISDERMTSVETGNRGIFRDKRWIIDANIQDGKITQSHVAWAGNPEGEVRDGDLTDKYTILYPRPAEWGSVYDNANNSMQALSSQLTTTLQSMPTIEKVEKGGEYGDMQYTNSIFSKLGGSFQAGDFDENSNFSDLKINGRTGYQDSTLAGGGDETKHSEKPTEEEEKTDDTAANTAPTTTVVTPSGGGGGMPRTTPSRGDSRGGDRGNLRYKLKKADPDDIYNQLMDKYGGTPGEGIQFGDGNSGTGSKLPGKGGSDPITLKPYTAPSSTSQDYTYKPSTTTPRTYTSDEGLTPYTPSTYDFKTPLPKYTSSDLGTTTSSTLSTPTSSGYSPLGGTTSYTSPTSTTTTTPSGTTIPSGRFNSMLDRLNSPIVTRGEAGTAGRNGTPGMSAGRSPTNVNVGGGGGAGAAPMRQNPATFGTGESAAGAQRGTVPGRPTGGGAMPGRGGMGMMPMMPMGGAGAPGAGGKGTKDGKKAQIKNQDGDLYGNDIQSVSPVISAGNKPAGMPRPEKKNNEN